MRDHFSPTYEVARRRLLGAAQRRGIPATSYAHPLAGPAGEELATDVVRLGVPEAERVLVLESGLHGPEGYAGSAIQLSILEEGVTLPEGVALLLVHAINPWGFAWTRRFNEDNIDLNRHFLDWDNPGSLDNAGYDALAHVLVPAGIDDDSMATADAVMEAYQKEHGVQAFREAVKRGQYKHPLGVFYGGLSPCWSALLIKRICDEHLAKVRAAGLIDVHTGLGPFAFGECLSTMAPETDEGRRATKWYGDVAHTKSPKTAYAGGSSSILEGYRRAAPWLEWTAIGLEFGTRDEKTVRDATRKDAWLHVNGGNGNPRAAEVKASLMHAFCPAEPEWRDAVVDRGQAVVKLGLEGLSDRRQAPTSFDASHTASSPDPA